MTANQGIMPIEGVQGDETWQWEIPDLNVVLIGKSPINGPFSSRPCLITRGSNGLIDGVINIVHLGYLDGIWMIWMICMEQRRIWMDLDVEIFC